jgi:hypothetical protein
VVADTSAIDLERVHDRHLRLTLGGSIARPTHHVGPSRNATFDARVEDIPSEQHEAFTLGLVAAGPVREIPPIAYVIYELSELADADFTAWTRFVCLAWSARRAWLGDVFLVDPIDVVEAEQGDGSCHGGGKGERGNRGCSSAMTMKRGRRAPERVIDGAPASARSEVPPRPVTRGTS